MSDISKLPLQATAVALDRPLKPFIFALLAWFGLLVLFNQLPTIDLTATSWFFHPETCADETLAGQICGSFPLSGLFVLKVIRMGFFYLPHAIATLLLVLVIYNYIRPPREAMIFVHKGLVLIASALLGPALLVNGVLKVWSGRPRPYDTLLFGGDLNFVPAGDFTGLCTHNCSFISGEGAGAGWLFCLIFLLPENKRRGVLAISVFIASFFAMGLRVAFGGHYLSDAVLGWLSTLVVFLLLSVLFGWPRARALNESQA